MKNEPKVIAILLAYNAADTLEKFYKELPKRELDDIILVDDSSWDSTFEIAKKLGIASFRNEVNLGYGGNLKKALCLALLRGADIIVDIHPDGEYDPKVIPKALKVGKGDYLVLGNRFFDFNYAFFKSGMFIWKAIPLLILNYVSKFVLRTDANDLHQGFRVYTRRFLERINFENNSNNYLFSFEIIAQAVFTKSRILEVPVLARYRGKKRGAKFISSINYSLGIFKILLLFLLLKIGYRSIIFQKPKGDLKYRAKNFLERI